jgi:DNA-binding transcriptional MerR regulator
VDGLASRAPLAATRRGFKGALTEDLVTVTDLAMELGISARTLRFYEDKGLIAPRRFGAARVYSNRERARMILILRGKQLGFSLREIKTYLDLYDADPKHETQTRSLLVKIADRRAQLEQQRGAIEQALRGLDDLERDAHALLERTSARGRRRSPKSQSPRFDASSAELSVIEETRP